MMTTWGGHTHDRQRQQAGRVATKATRPADEDVVTTPSQAEGDREDDGKSDGQGDIVHTPSQAEGDRETIERDLKEKE